MIDECTAGSGMGRMRITSFDGLLIDLVHREQADCIVRGLRAVSDFEYEFQMALMNRKLRHTVETVFIMPHEKLHVHLLAPHQGSLVAGRAGHRHGAAARSRSAWLRSSRAQIVGRRHARRPHEDPCPLADPRHAGQGPGHARAGHRRHLLRRGRARLRHARAASRTPRSARSSRARPSTPRSAASPSCAPRSATSSSATTGSSTRRTRSPSPAGPSTRSTTS